MGTISFEDYQKKSSSPREDAKAAKGKNYHDGIEFFKLGDGEEAIVRFMYADTSEFRLETVHQVESYVNGKKRFLEISCNKGHDDHCVFCDAGMATKTKFLVKMLQYTIENGNIVKKAVVWSRPANFANTLASLERDYGPLKGNLFKISRTGKGLDTRWSEPRYASPAVYKPELYSADDEGIFDDWDPKGMLFYTRQNDAMQRFLDTGEFYGEDDKFETNQAVKPVEKTAEERLAALDEDPLESPFVRQPQQAKPTQVEEEKQTFGPRRTYNY